jgi:hypothetical protein
MANKSNSKSDTKVMFCTCSHDYQDARYGKNNRVHNYAPKGSATGGYRCTVCGKVK